MLRGHLKFHLNYCSKGLMQTGQFKLARTFLVPIIDSKTSINSTSTHSRGSNAFAVSKTLCLNEIYLNPISLSAFDPSILIVPGKYFTSPTSPVCLSKPKYFSPGLPTGIFSAIAVPLYAYLRISAIACVGPKPSQAIYLCPSALEEFS